MCDPHKVIIHNIGEIVGRQSIALQKNLIVEVRIFYRNASENFIDESGASAIRDSLPYYKGAPAAALASDSSFESRRQGSSVLAKSPASSSDSVFSQKHR